MSYSYTNLYSQYLDDLHLSTKVKMKTKAVSLEKFIAEKPPQLLS